MKELFELSLAFRGISDDAEAEEDATFLAGDDELEDDVTKNQLPRVRKLVFYCKIRVAHEKTRQSEDLAGDRHCAHKLRDRRLSCDTLFCKNGALGGPNFKPANRAVDQNL